MKATEIIHAHGHENILSTNRTTFEATKDRHLTRRGDCIIAVKSTKGAAELNHDFKRIAENDNAHITVTIETEDLVETVRAWGSSRLTLAHPTDLVVRKSDYVCSRTLAVRADKSANDFSRKLVAKLQDSAQTVKIVLVAEIDTT